MKQTVSHDAATDVGAVRCMARLTFYAQVLIVLVALCAIRLWTATPDILPAAFAQGKGGVPDSGAQRRQLIAQNERTNELLAEIDKHLRAGPVPVTVMDDSVMQGRDGN